jgi:hypothetical protein
MYKEVQSIDFADDTLTERAARACLGTLLRRQSRPLSINSTLTTHCTTLTHSDTRPLPFPSTQNLTGNSLLLTIFPASVPACQFTHPLTHSLTHLLARSRPPVVLGHVRPSIPFISRIRCDHTLLFSRVARKREANILGGLSKGSGRRKTAC